MNDSVTDPQAPIADVPSPGIAADKDPTGLSSGNNNNNDDNEKRRR